MPLLTTDVDAVADMLCRAYDQKKQVSLSDLNEYSPTDIDDAYAIQNAVAAKLWLNNECRTDTWKAGGMGKELLRYAAPIPPFLVSQSPALFNADSFHMIGIEAELAYRLNTDCPKREVPYSDDEVWAAIDSVCVTIEVVDTRIKEWQQAGKWWQLADNQINGALVVGSGIKGWRSVQPEQQTVELLIDGVGAELPRRTHPMGDPLPLLPWTVNHCAQINGGLKAGDLITTGSWTGMVFVQPGSEVTARFTGIGVATVKFAK